MKKDGTTFYWCKTCGYSNKGYWVSTHRPEDCYRKKKSEEKSSKDTEEVAEGNIVPELTECEFLIIL